ncbi:hypothetical protein [Streptomyces zaomyceticus]|uniref:hypothetical protein n=1 Tax=Streptomyces zaomyceticus TaxID=68286 RepID=UPI00378DA105
MGAQLKSTVYVKDPDTHQTVELAPGTCPEPRLAALVTSPAAWVDGKLPRLRTSQKPEQKETPEGGDDPGAAPGPADSDTGSDDGSTPSSDEEPNADPASEPDPVKPARKTTARKPAAQ